MNFNANEELPADSRIQLLQGGAGKVGASEPHIPMDPGCSQGGFNFAMPKETPQGAVLKT